VSIRADLAFVERRVDAIAGDVPTPQHVASFERFLPTGALSHAIVTGARAAQLDPALVAAVAQTESGGDPTARSAAGAEGVMQLMPATARALGVADPYDPVQNVRAGAAYLRTLIDRFGDLTSAIAAYNAGPGAVARYGGVPPYAETRVYVERVMDAYRANLRR
jgi:soluble lytic murein transglycosylase-like protein